MERKVNRQPENTKSSLNFLPCRQMQENIYWGLSVSASYWPRCIGMRPGGSAFWIYHTIKWNIPWTTARAKYNIGQRLYGICIMMCVYNFYSLVCYPPCVCVCVWYWHANITLGFCMYFWYFFHVFIIVWWMRSIYSYQWLMALRGHINRPQSESEE